MHRGVGYEGIMVLNKQILYILVVAGGENSYWSFNSSQAVSNHTL